MPKRKSFEHESYQDGQTIGKYLQSLVEGFENGKILLRTESENMELCPADLLKFGIKAKKDGDKSKLTIKISWKTAKIDALSQTSVMIETSNE